MDIHEAYKAFRMQTDLFLTACEELESDEVWTELRIPMDTALKTDLFGITLHLMSADGALEEKEVALFNELFGTSYLPEELEGLCQGLMPVLDTYLAGDESTALAKLDAADEVLAGMYRRILLQACTLMAQSDGYEEWAEVALIERLREMLEG